jgi:hypothetical protein
MKGPYISVDGTSATVTLKPAAPVAEITERKQKVKKVEKKTLDKWFDMPGMHRIYL